MTRNDAIANLKMIMIAYVEPPKTAEQIKLINDTFDMAIEALKVYPNNEDTDEVDLVKMQYIDKINSIYGMYAQNLVKEGKTDGTL